MTFEDYGDLPSSFRWRDITAHDNARQINGNVTNNNHYHYGPRRRRSDETLRENDRNDVLLKAAAEGQTPRVRYLIQLGADLDHVDSDDFTALHHAALSGFEDTADVLIQAGADTNPKHLDGITPLHLAALRGRSNVVDLLLRHRANAAAVSTLLGTSLHCASFSGSVEIAKAVATRRPRLCNSVHCIRLDKFRSHGESQISFGFIPADLAQEDLLCSPLHLAALQGNHDVLDLLLTYDADMDARARISKDSTESWSSLELALKNYQASTTVARLLQRNPYVNLGAVELAIYSDSSECLNVLRHFKVPAGLIGEVDSDRRLFNLYLSDSVDKPRLELLTKAGAQIDIAPKRFFMGDRQETALMCAASYSRLDRIDLLLEAGASLQMGDSCGETAIMQAARAENISVLEQLLYRATIDNLNQQDRDGTTALLGAIMSDSMKSFDLLLAKGASIFVKDKSGRNAIMAAVLSKAPTTWNLRRILRHTVAIINETDTHGYTALMLAVKYDKPDCIRCLLEHGASLDISNVGGRTALMMATERGNHAVMSLLLESGARVDQRDWYGLTALIFAVRNGSLACVQTLSEFGADLSVITSRRSTAVAEAIVNDRKDIISFLVEHGADLDVQRDDGYTPKALARKAERYDLVNAIQSGIAIRQAAQGNSQAPKSSHEKQTGHNKVPTISRSGPRDYRGVEYRKRKGILK